QSISRIETAEEENCWYIAWEAARRRSRRFKDVRVDAIRDDLPVRVEIAIERDDRAVRNSDRAAEHVQALLEVPPAQRVADGLVEVRVERADDGAFRLFDREQW